MADNCSNLESSASHTDVYCSLGKSIIRDENGLIVPVVLCPIYRKECGTLKIKPKEVKPLRIVL